jgi:mannose-1-phosphate guanylyltransferase
MIYAVIMAGGSGTRFWPLSREAMPKQFLAIGEPQPLLAATAERMLPLCGWKGLMVVASQKHMGPVRKILKKIPKKNLIVEPRPRNTAPAIGLAAAAIASRDPDGIMVVLPSDHIIRPPGRFRKLIRAAVSEARTGALVTLGVVPTQPETGYGYIQAGRELRSVGGSQVFEVEAFTEKPDLPRAQEFVKAGNYYWNSGMFVFKAAAIMRALASHTPELHAGLQIAFSAPDQKRNNLLKRLFNRIEGISIDYAVMEKASNIHMLPCDTQWSDVGSWAALPGVKKLDEAGSVVAGDVLALDSHGCILHSEGRLLACVGLQDMVVVETPEAILVCPVKEAQRVKLIVEELRRRKRKDVL